MSNRWVLNRYKLCIAFHLISINLENELLFFFKFQQIGNSSKEYDKAVVAFSIKNQLRFKGNLVRQVRTVRTTHVRHCHYIAN